MYLCPMHIGHEILIKIQERDQTIVGFAKQLGCSRVNVYKILDKRSLDTNTLMRISRILDFDFFQLYSDELKINNN